MNRQTLDCKKSFLNCILAKRREHWERIQIAKLSVFGKASIGDSWKTRYEIPLSCDPVQLPPLPDGWTWATVDQIAELVTKGSSPNWQGFQYCQHGIVFIRSQNVDWGSLDLSDIAHLPPSFNDKERKSVLRKGDVLLNIVGASIGRVAIASKELDGGNVNQAVAVIRLVPNGVLNAFLVFYFLSPDAQRRIHSKKVDVARANVSLEDIRALPIPLAPPDEQHRIVAEIEKQFTRLDAGVASLKRVQVALKRYRASVLKAACEGRLTRTKIPCALIPLRELITGLGQGWSPKCELNRDPLPGEWAVIKTTAVQSMKYLDCESKPLPTSLAPRPSIEIKVGDFLMTRKGPRQRAGVTCLVRATRERLMVCDTVYRFRCQESRVNPSYLELALNSPQAVSEIDKRKSGINDSGVSLTHEKLGGVLLPIPTLGEQERIVSDVERRLSVVEELEAVVAANLKRAERLRQSVLHRAFSGDLQTRSQGKKQCCVGE